MTFPLAMTVRTFFAPAAVNAFCRSAILTNPLPPTLTARRNATCVIAPCTSWTDNVRTFGPTLDDSHRLRTRFRARMRSPIHVEQLRRIHMRIPLRRRQRDVAEQFLDRAQVGTALEQMRREGVPQRVRADPEPRTAQTDVAGHQPLHASARQAGTPEVNEQRVTLCLRALRALRVLRVLRGSQLAEQRIPVFQPPRERLLRRVVEWNNPLLRALPHHPHHPGAQVDVLNVEADKLAQAQAGRVEQLEDRAVAAAERIAGVWSRQQSAR